MSNADRIAQFVADRQTATVELFNPGYLFTITGTVVSVRSGAFAVAVSHAAHSAVISVDIGRILCIEAMPNGRWVIRLREEVK